ncbi:VWA domain-containing protein [Mangrovimicrobium sediminis]|uniref:VWA domain-containing protein n=1 Tax=Mangrovimicrobium sediminis TaxID=2562682 RepID=A0A4Z0M3H5_9GAMM|nr:VWA domain-containing protein [Haliea sp. SAOS-164]TGD74000.1 VWA domain-containing protein [Haliea sp. SAOS-164]
MAKPPAQRSSRTEIDQFLRKRRDIVEFVDRQPRLMFCLDATASRQPTWDRASHLQREMFLAVNQSGSLSVQLCYYRGFGEFQATGWTGDSQKLAANMGRVSCEGGHTQIERLLEHALREHGRSRVRALVFIGDAIEEHPDRLCRLAGQCGLRGLPLFIFQEGELRDAERCFRRMCQLSGGAWARFDQNSPGTLAALLSAVASFAAGGVAALEKQGNESAKLLLEQLKP